jgi:predicted SnoaL-like aldol condensation-catalyzing enzyme
MRLFRIAALMGVALATPAFADRTAREAANAATVTTFLDTVFNKHKVAAAFENYVGVDYIQHNPYVPTGKDAGVKALSALVAKFPQLHIDIVQVIVDGDLVSVHSHEIKQPGERGSAIGEFFRLSNGKIVEHWDVIQDVMDPALAKNPNTMF